MIAHDIPLNQGCMRPIEVILPPGSLLDPHKDAAVVGGWMNTAFAVASDSSSFLCSGGNVLTSQRLVDVILRAFGACAASQVSLPFSIYVS